MPTRQARRPLLDREQVARAALDILQHRGLDAVSMRNVAERLGVSAMHLYRYVADKDDLLDAMVDEALAGAEDIPGEGAWDERLVTTVRRERDRLRRYPDLARLVLSRPVLTPRGLAHVRAVADLLADAGLPPETAIPVFVLLRNFAISSVVVDRSRDADTYGRVVAGAMRGLDVEDALAALQLIGTRDADAEFELGLRVILDGLRAQVQR